MTRELVLSRLALTPQSHHSCWLVLIADTAVAAYGCVWSGRAGLHLAASSGNKQVVEALLEQPGVSINFQDRSVIATP